jgi:hypothetical protein
MVEKKYETLFIRAYEGQKQINLNVSHIIEWDYSERGDEKTPTVDVYITGGRVHTLKEMDAVQFKVEMESYLILK